VYDSRELPLQTGGNLYYRGARPYFDEADAVVDATNPNIKLLQDGQRVRLHLTLGEAVRKPNAELVTTQLLNKAKVSGLHFDGPDGLPSTIDADYFGNKRDNHRPTPGPFENPAIGPLELNVW
jgi:hypothetical protein